MVTMTAVAGWCPGGFISMVELSQYRGVRRGGLGGSAEPPFQVNDIHTLFMYR